MNQPPPSENAREFLALMRELFVKCTKGKIAPFDAWLRAGPILWVLSVLKSLETKRRGPVYYPIE
jgi:hypothetical protein